MRLNTILEVLTNNRDLFEDNLFEHKLDLDIINIAVQDNELFVTYIQNRNSLKEHIGCCRIELTKENYNE